MDNDILFFVKFGKRSHLENMIKGKMYFSNAERFREIEKEQLKRLQGDKHDGIFKILEESAIVIPYNSPYPSMKLDYPSFNIDFEDNKRKATFCIIAGTRKNCSYYNDESNYKIKFSDLQSNLIKDHFTEADSVLLIKKPKLFIKNIFENIGHACYSHKAFYYNKEHFTIDDFQEFFTDNKIDCAKRTEGIITNQNVHKFLLCKDIFFLQQQEYRVILYKTKIGEPQEFSISPILDGKIYSLDEFFSGIKV